MQGLRSSDSRHRPGSSSNSRCNAPLYLTPSSPEILKLSSVDAENNLAEAQLPAVIPSRGFGSELRPSENKCDARPAVFAGRSDLFPQLGYIQLGYTS